MKKCIVAVLLVIVFSMMLTCAFAAADNAGAWQNQLFFFNRIANEKEETVAPPLETAIRLPASLRVIEDEAFAETAIVSVDLPDTVESIGDHAFANIPTLLSVKILENTKEIAKTAFAGSNHVTLTGLPGSYARTWAKENGIPFTLVAIMYAGNGMVQVSASIHPKYEPVGMAAMSSAELAQKCPQWRAADETHSERYDKWFTNHISGRAPPAGA